MSEVRRRGGDRNRSLYLFGVLAVLFITMAVMAGGEVGGWERASFEAIYGASEGWRSVALLVTQAGSVWFWLALVALLFIVRRRPGAGLGMFRNGIIAYIAVLAIKLLVARPRPELLLQDVVPREVITFGLGFPSGHVAIATVMALTIRPYFNGIWRWVVPAIWITLVGWSRLYLGVHAPLDILGGAVLGAMIMILAGYLPAKGAWSPEKTKS